MKHELSTKTVFGTNNAPFGPCDEDDLLPASVGKVEVRLNGSDCWQGRADLTHSSETGQGANDSRAKLPGLY